MSEENEEQQDAHQDDVEEATSDDFEGSSEESSLSGEAEEATSDDFEGSSEESSLSGEAEEATSDDFEGSSEESSLSGEAEEGDADEGDSEEGDAEEGDSEEGDSEEGDSEEGDSEEGDSEEGDAEEGDAEEGDADEADNSEEEEPYVFAVTPRLVNSIEAMIFCSREPVTIKHMVDHFRAGGAKFSQEEIRELLKGLKSRWDEREESGEGGFVLSTAAKGWMFRTTAEVADFVRPMFSDKPQRLSRAALETLSIVAYRQPMTRPQIDEVRGVDSGGALKNLLEKSLVRILGKSEDVGRPLLYGTTKTFLEFFSIASLRDLPTLREYRDLSGEDLFKSLPEEEQNEENRAVVMDLFDPDRGAIVSDETDVESSNALNALEEALLDVVEINKGGKPRSRPPAEGSVGAALAAEDAANEANDESATDVSDGESDDSDVAGDDAAGDEDVVVEDDFDENMTEDEAAAEMEAVLDEIDSIESRGEGEESENSPEADEDDADEDDADEDDADEDDADEDDADEDDADPSEDENSLAAEDAEEDKDDD